MNANRERIYSAARRIPPGKVATYGDIAAMAGLDGHARQVGYALHDLPDGSDVPWHRVINARGAISPRSAGDSHELQRLLLESEGVEFDLGGRVELKRYRWRGDERRAGRRRASSEQGNGGGAGRRRASSEQEKRVKNLDRQKSEG